MHAVTSTYATPPISLYKARQETNLTLSSFPAVVQQGLLSLLVFKRVLYLAGA